MQSGVNIGHKRQASADHFLRIASEAFREGGWSASVEPRLPSDDGPDLLIEKDGLRYIVELKCVSDGKRARLLPLLSMAILESKAAAQSQAGLRPMAIVMAPHIEERVAEQVWQFASSHAPDVAIAVLDFDGLRRFWGDGLQELNFERPRELQIKALKVDDAGSNLFSDVNQWLLKVFLGQRLPEQLINVPRGEFHNASQLADLANVSVMSAFRFLRQLENEGFLDSAAVPRLANLERLLSRWQSAMLKPQREIWCRWLIRGGDQQRLVNAINKYQNLISQDGIDSQSLRERELQPNLKLCLGGFAAASWLGFGHVSGMPPLLYMERINSEVLRRLGLAKIEDSRAADVLVKIPSFKEALFRAAVILNNIRVSDVLQIWLESSVNPARGAEQADLIKRRLLDPIIQDNS